MARQTVMTFGLTVFFSCLASAPAFAGQLDTPGQLSVNESGAASYSLPIAALPGTAGMQPKLSLDYNSHGGNGILGVGWSLGGLPAITRCAQTLAQDSPAAHGGVDGGGINFDANDRFCMEGERLVAISGTYGADGTEYRLEREGFTKIVSYGTAGTGPAWFKVWTKSGQIMEFGNTTESRVEAEGKATVKVWAVNRISDTAGNYMTVAYQEDNANGHYYPTRIDYTGNSAQSVAPYASIRFEYEYRPASDQTPLYTGGSKTRVNNRLVLIQTFLGPSIIFGYRINYDQSAATLRSRITSIQQCDPTSTCLPATTFTWQDGGPLTQVATLATPFGDADESTLGQRWFVTDVNGDGRQDLMIRGGTGDINTYQANGTSFDLTSTLTTGAGDHNENTLGKRWFAVDQNGDGRSDMVVRVQGDFLVYQSTGPSWAWGGQYHTGFTNVDESTLGQRFFMMDVNGDGKQDIVVRDPTGGFGVYLSDGATYAYSGSLTTTFGDKNPNTGARYFVMDVNGDGKQDMVIRNSTNFTIYLSNGTTFVQSGTLTTHIGDKDEGAWGQTWFVTDVNSDGKQDLLIRDGNGVFFTFLSTGTTFTACTLSTPNCQFNTGIGDISMANGRRYFLMDANGDGKQDLLVRNGSNFNLYLATGASFAYVTTLATHIGNQNEGTTGPAWFIMDLNGDGRQDLVARDGGGTFYTYISTGDGFTTCTVTPSQACTLGPLVTVFGNKNPNLGPRYFPMDVDGDGRTDMVVRDGTTLYVHKASSSFPDLISSVSNGIGATTTITYKTIAEGGTLYSRSFNATMPTVDVQGPMMVVSQLQAPTNDAGSPNYTTTYRYKDFKANVLGRGALGFREVVARDEQTGIESTTVFRQDWPYIGMPSSRSKVRTATGVELNRVENTYASTAQSPATTPARNFVALTQSVESSKELNGTSLPTVTTGYTYDSYGNAATVTVSTGDGYSKVTTNTYTNDVTNWILGRLTRAVVQSTTP